MQYTLERFNWQWNEAGFLLLPGTTRLQSFTDREEAEAERWRREWEARDKVNPFRCGPQLHYQSSFPEYILHDWLLDAGIEPPVVKPDGSRDWPNWWERTRKDMTESQQAKVWESLDRVQFYRVVERPAGATAFVVVRLMWEYNDNWWEPGREGGSSQKAFRRREDAVAYCELLAERERENWRFLEDAARDPFETTAIEVRRGDPFEPPSGLSFAAVRAAPFFEVVEIDLETTFSS